TPVFRWFTTRSAPATGISATCAGTLPAWRAISASIWGGCRRQTPRHEGYGQAAVWHAPVCAGGTDASVYNGRLLEHIGSLNIGHSECRPCFRSKAVATLLFTGAVQTIIFEPSLQTIRWAL